MTTDNRQTLLAAVCDFGWGSLGKFRLILDKLPATDVILYGDASINSITTDLLRSRHRFLHRPPAESNVALVINDPAAANRIADLGIPVVYVDSLPYLWTTAEEIPERHKIAYYCAQKFPSDRLSVSGPLRHWHEIHWIDPIVPTPTCRRGGHGVVINVGGLHSHLVGDTVDAYLGLVLIPLVKELKSLGRTVSAVCGNLPAETCRQLGEMLPDCRAIGRQSPYDFEDLLKGADLLITSPGSTTILQALALGLSTMLLLPQNLSQYLNMHLFASPGAPTMAWPASVVAPERIEQLRLDGEDAVLTYFYRAICDAAASPLAAAEVTEIVRAGLCTMPEAGVLDPSMVTLGGNGAEQVARLIKQAMLAPTRRRETASRHGEPAPADD
jgi:hydroxymethylcytosylglucuronate/cytosylglucuronate synthase